MNIYTPEQVESCYKDTETERNLSSVDIMRRIGKVVAGEVMNLYSGSKPVIVFAGAGRKGAEAIATALHLAEQGVKPNVYVVNPGGNSLSHCTAQMLDELKKHTDLSITEYKYARSFFFPEMTDNHIIVDGLYGPEKKDSVSDGLKSLVESVNNSGAYVVSIENPSGLPGWLDGSIVCSQTVHASLTLAVHAVYPTFMLDEVADVVGELKVLDVGLCDNVPLSAKLFAMSGPGDVGALLLHRESTCSKADFGNGLLVAGQYGMMGAAVLAAKGALRSGIGKLTVLSPYCGFVVVQTSVPEALFRADVDGKIITEIKRAVEENRYDSVGIGPGLGHGNSTMKALEDFLSAHKHNHKIKLVLDADALNCIYLCPNMLNYIPRRSVITPHKGEFDRLFGKHDSDNRRLAKAIDMARKYGINIVLKGHYTAIVRYDGFVFFNTTGTPAMATAGSGDVLTGVILSLLAQGYEPEKAAVIGVCIHGLAGELAENQYGEYGVTASDIAEKLGQAIRSLMV